MVRACKTMRSVWLWSHALGRHSACLVSTSVLAGLYTLSFSRSILVISPIHYILAFPPMHSEGFRFIVWGLGVELCSPISSWWPQPSATIRNRPQCIDNRMVNSVWLGVSQVWAYSVCVVDMSCVAGAALDAAHVAMKGRGGGSWHEQWIWYGDVRFMWQAQNFPSLHSSWGVCLWQAQCLPEMLRGSATKLWQDRRFGRSSSLKCSACGVFGRVCAIVFSIVCVICATFFSAFCILFFSLKMTIFLISFLCL